VPRWNEPTTTLLTIGPLNLDVNKPITRRQRGTRRLYARISLVKTLASQRDSHDLLTQSTKNKIELKHRQLSIIKRVDKMPHWLIRSKTPNTVHPFPPMSFPQATNFPENVDTVRSSDAELIQIMRDGDLQTIDELKAALGVTATAVRQRIERLLESGLVQREKVVAGRGRPVFKYVLTIDGHRHGGADAAEFAEAMWREIMMLRDSPIRRRLISAVAKRLGMMYATRLSEHASRLSGSLGAAGPASVGQWPDQPSLEQRMRSLSSVLTRQQISAGVHVARFEDSSLPVLDIGACPYPTLRDHPSDRSLCKMEEEMLSIALGTPVHLTSCQLDGGHCCQFSPSTVAPMK